MKRFLLWSFERGSFQYDIICAVILAIIFLTPRSAFNDRPDFMRVSASDPVRQTTDDNGNTVFTVKLETPPFTAAEDAQLEAVEQLKQSLHTSFKVLRTVPVYDTMGGLIAYSIWIEKEH